MSSVLGGDDKGTNVRSIHTIFNQQKMLGNMTLNVFFCFFLSQVLQFTMRRKVTIPMTIQLEGF